MKVTVEIYGELETVEASADFWLKMLTALNEAAEHSREQGFTVTAKEYDRIHDEISNQTWNEILKMEVK